MRLTVTFKDPDAVYSAVARAIQLRPELTDLEAEELAEELGEKVRGWFRYGEYADISIDTEAGTARLVRPS